MVQFEHICGEVWFSNYARRYCQIENLIYWVGFTGFGFQGEVFGILGAERFHYSTFYVYTWYGGYVTRTCNKSSHLAPLLVTISDRQSAFGSVQWINFFCVGLC